MLISHMFACEEQGCNDAKDLSSNPSYVTPLLYD